MTNQRRRSGGTPPPAPLPEINHEAVTSIVTEVRARLNKAGRPALADELRAKYGADVDCHGINPADVHNIGMDYVRRLRSPGYPLTLGVSEELCMSGNLEEGLIGAQLVGALARHVAGGDFDRFERWASKVSNGLTAEAVAFSCISKAMSAKPSVAMRLLEWTKSESRWIRIAAVASFSPLVRDGRFMTDALMVAAPLMNDEDELVQVVVGTMLMEMTRLKADRVVEFLGPLKDSVPQSVLQLAATKLTGPDRAAVLG
jgi:3-methyladenine DNA glycosylase AlkD